MRRDALLQTACRWIARARRVVAWVLIAVAILAALGAERVDPDVQPPMYHAIRPHRGDVPR